MTQEEVAQVVRQVLAAERESHQVQQDDVVLRTIATILTSFGIEEEDRKELKADFIHLRKWRKSVEQAQSLTFKVIITTIISGFLGAVWLGVKALLGK